MDKIKKIITIFLLILILLIVWAIISFSFYDENDNLGNGYTYYSEQQHISGGHEIPPRVIEYKYNDDIIIAKQRPMKYANIMYKEYNYFMGRDTLYYWIIEKKHHRIIGPQDYKIFRKRVSEYNDKSLFFEE